MMLPTLRPDQNKILQTIDANTNIICILPRGTGKTTIALQYAIDHFLAPVKWSGVYVCHKRPICRTVIETLEYNILVNPNNIYDIKDMGMYGKRFESNTGNLLDVLPFDKFAHAPGSDYVILDEFDVITDQTQNEIFKMISNYNTQHRIIFTSLAYKSFIDKLNTKTFGPYKVVKL